MANKEAKQYLSEVADSLIEEEEKTEVIEESTDNKSDYIDSVINEAPEDEVEGGEEEAELDIDAGEEEEAGEEPQEDLSPEPQEGVGASVPAGMIKNFVDIINDYVRSQYKITNEEKNEIIKNMQISVGEFEPENAGLKVVGNSMYVTGQKEKKPVEIVLEMVTTNGPA